MHVHRFINPLSLAPGQLTLVDQSLVLQLTRVLRLHVGERIILCDGQGSEAEAEIRRISSDAVEVWVGEVRPVASEPSRFVSLACAILKRDKFEFVVQKATEVGVREIIPLITARTVKQRLRLDRLGTIAREAAEQSGRGSVPTIREPLALETLLQEENSGRIRLLTDMASEQTIPDAIAQAASAQIQVLV